MDKIKIDIENIGGISELTATFRNGVTLVQGPNATNKTSLLKSVLFVLGASNAPIKSNAEVGRVRLSMGDRTVERTAQRTESGIEIGGESWVEDADDQHLLERFAGLLGTNPLRTAVSQNTEIETFLKEPMDIDALEAERSEKMQRKHKLENHMKELAGIDQQLTDHEHELSEKRDREHELEERLAELETAHDKPMAAEDEQLAELRERQASLRSEKVDSQEGINRLESAIDRLEEQLAETERQIDDTEATVEDTNIEELKGRRADIRSELEEVETRLDILQSVLTANREMLDSEFTGILGYEAGLDGDTFDCWACGKPANREAFEGTDEELRDLIERDKQRRREREPELDELEGRIEAARGARSQQQELAAKRRDIEQQLEERRDSLSQRRSRLDEVRSDLQSVDNEITEQESEREQNGNEVDEEIESLRVEIRTLRRNIDRAESVHDELVEKQRERDRKAEHVEELGEEITALTDRIENLEDELREQFNAAMDDLLEVLDFERIERVWLDGNFDLVIARDVDGSIRADTIEHLAESEREMIGLVLGFAGYLTYDVDKVSPVLVVDSLGAFDDERTERLIDYFADKTDVLLAAVHPTTTERNGYATVSFKQPITG